jgi:hypothetical protein
MPLHEWSDRPGWEGMHHLWITEVDQTYARAAEDAYQT